jgi:hypothetical protein
LALLCLTAAAPAAGAQQPSPQKLAAALATSVAPSGLPAGIASPRVTRQTLSAAARRRHAVAIEFRRGNAFVFYIVFPRHADAAAYWRDTLRSPENHGLTRDPARGLPQPAAILSGKQKGLGYSAAIFVKDNVAVAAAPTPVRGAATADRGATLVLGRFALQHLTAAERRATP